MRLAECVAVIQFVMIILFCTENCIFSSYKNYIKVVNAEQEFNKDEFIVNGFLSNCRKSDRAEDSSESSDILWNENIENWKEIVLTLENCNELKIEKTESGMKQSWISLGRKVYVEYKKGENNDRKKFIECD